MNYKELYHHWLECDYFDINTKNELKALEGNEKEIEDRFYRELEFGTGGMRGVIGAGTNRMNAYTVRKAAQGLANFIKKRPGETEKGVAIAFDSRHRSKEFAVETALVFAANGMKAYLFDELRPTPELSFAVRHLGCAAGVVITASHNPKEYNGFKAYSSDGCQLPPKESDEVILEVNAIEDLSLISSMDREEALQKGLLVIIGQEIDDAYIEALKKVCVNPKLAKEVGKDTKILYTPLHGSGNKLVRRILKEIGFENVQVVKEQELPDPDFSTVKYPNPEEKAAFTIGIEMAKKEGIDLIIATDPDADRMGIVVKDASGEYVTLTGNQTGCLLLEYVLSQKKAQNELPDNAFVVKTIVSTELARTITDHYKVELIEVLTGFKFIGEQIRLLDDTGLKRYVFGFEESYGYLAGTHARDKDAVVASMLLAEVYAWYKSKGMNLYQGLAEVYEKYGYAKEGIDSFTLKGKEGLERIEAAMESMRQDGTSLFKAARVVSVSDYQKGIKKDFITGSETRLTLPESNVLQYKTQSGAWFCARPSGTEPKIKFYYGVSGNSVENADQLLNDLRGVVLNAVKPLLD